MTMSKNLNRGSTPRFSHKRLNKARFYQRTNRSTRSFIVAVLTLTLRAMPIWVDGGLCPFHQDKRIGSFKINSSTGAFKCFSCNASGGDIISFTMKYHDFSFPEALDWFTEQWGVVCE